jgi:hypothetical protein
MKFISKSALLALTTSLVLSAVVVSSAAAALPEFQKEGKALSEAVKFTGTTNSSRWEDTEGYAGSTPSGPITGEFKGSNEIAKTALTFGPSSSGYPVKGGDLLGKELKGNIGYTSKALKQVGALLGGPTQMFVESEKIKGQGIDGSIIGTITPINKATTTFTIAYQETSGHESLTHFEGSEVLHRLELISSGLEIGLASDFTITTSKAIELKA